MGQFQGIELADLVLDSPRLSLRPWRPGDADSVFDAMQDRRMHRYLPLPDPYTRADAAAFVSGLGDEGRAEGAGIGCALVEKASGRVVGSAALRLPRRNRDADIGYAVYPGAQGNGYAAEAARALAEWGFGQGLGRIEIDCAVTNLASACSAMRAGFSFEGVARDGGHTAGGDESGARFARLARDGGGPVAPVAAGLPTDGLSDGTIRIRAIGPGDALGLDESEDELAQRWAFNTHRMSRVELDRLCAEAPLRWLVGPVLRMAIVAEATDAFAGFVTIRHEGPPQVGGIGYGVHPAFRGRGYTSRALRLIADWAFGVADFAVLELGAKRENVASQRAALGGGFDPDGVRAARLRNADGSFSDEVRFVKINPKYLP